MKLKCPFCGHHKWQRIPYKNDLCGHLFITCGVYDDNGELEKGCGQRYLVDYIMSLKLKSLKSFQKDKSYG